MHLSPPPHAASLHTSTSPSTPLHRLVEAQSENWSTHLLHMWGRMQGFSWTIHKEREEHIFQTSLQLDVEKWKWETVRWTSNEHSEHTSLLEGEDSKLSSCSRCLLDDSAPGGDGEPEPGDCRGGSRVGTEGTTQSVNWNPQVRTMHHVLPNKLGCPHIGQLGSLWTWADDEIYITPTKKTSFEFYDISHSICILSCTDSCL